MTKCELLIPLASAIEHVKDQPDIEFIWLGIPNTPSVNLIAAPAKAGKSILAENLSYALLDDTAQFFLGQPILTLNRICMISFEEHIIPRTMRQRKQLLDYPHDDAIKVIESNFFVLSFDFSPADSGSLERLMQELTMLKVDLLIIDSLGRLASDGPIEDSLYAQKVMLYLRKMATTLNIPIIVLHHTIKLKNGRSADMSSMAGSRVVAQEADSMITIDRKEGNTRIVRPLAYRYSGASTEVSFSINDSCMVEQVPENSNESAPLRVDKVKLLDQYMMDKCIVTTQELKDFVSDNKLMSRATLFESLKKIPHLKRDKGIYIHTSCTKLDNNIKF